MSNLDNKTPNALVLTTDGKVKLSVLGFGAIKAKTDQVPVQLIITELCLEIYGIIFRTFGPKPDIIKSSVVDEKVKFGCREQDLTVDVAVHNESNHAFVPEYRLEFTDELDWLECVRFLEQAQAQRALHKLCLRENLKIAEAKDIIPEM